MTAPLVSNLSDNWLLPGSPSDSRLFHADEADGIQVCSSYLGQGYRQTISLQDDLTLAIHDYTLSQPRVIDTPGRVNCLEFEFRLAGPDAGYSSFIPYFGLKEFGAKPAQKRCFNVEVWFKRPALSTYFQAFMERLSPQLQTTAKRIIQLIYRHHGGGPRSTPVGMLNQIFDCAKGFGSQFALEQIVTDTLCTEVLELDYAARRSITPAMERVIGQILSCPYQGATRRTYLERKALQLVGLRLEAMLQPRSDVDLSGIYQAGAILREQIVSPPTVETLARMVCTNRKKLYQGFYEVYGTTPLGYSRNCRLVQARRLLMTSDLSVEAVAAAVGYTNRSKFAAVFRQLIGINPKAFQMQAWKLS
ncbi:MAG: helix-turn-helix transcriptional regulator [Cyanobacteria bacterium P01_H01_bin.119]